MIQVDILTIFPGSLLDWLQSSIPKIAQKKRV
jgi:hypothetical protein